MDNSQQNQTQSPLDLLSQLIGNLPQPGTPQFNGQGPMAPPATDDAKALAPPPTPGSTADLESKVPQLPRQFPQASDDPAITGARAQLDRSQGQIQDSLGRMQSAQQKIAAVPPVNPANYQPSWKDRLMGAGVGTLAGIGDPRQAGPAAHNFAYRGLERADANRAHTLAPLLQQLATERQALPLYKDSADTAWKQFEGGRQDREDAIKQQNADTNQEFKESIADIRQQIANGNSDTAQQKIAQAEKQLAERTENDKGKLDMQRQLLDLKQQIFDAKVAKGNPADKPATKAQFAMVEQRKATGLAKAEAQYQREIALIGPTDANGRQEVADRLAQNKQDVQDSYLEQQAALQGNPDGGAPKPAAATPKTAATPAAASPQAPTAQAPPSSLWKGKEGKVLVLKTAQGKTERWQLIGGTPKLVKGASPDGN